MVLNKTELRNIMRERRRNLSKAEKGKLDNIIFNNVVNDNNFIKSNKIFVYVSYASEVDTHKIIQYALNQGKTVCVPKILSLNQGMVAVKIKNFFDLKPNKMGILEPETYIDVVNADEIELVILPGLAFDYAGGRLGYGGGFYDRFLLKIQDNVKKLALAYKLQVLVSVPMDENDIKVDVIITD